MLALAGMLALVVGGYFGWPVAQSYFNKPAPAPKPAEPKASVPTTPSETLNAIAHAPANAINKAQEAIATRRASGQARIDAASIGEDLPSAPFGPPPAAPVQTGPAQPQTTSAQPATTTTSVAPGVTATTPVVAAPEAAAPFRAFVANAKISGVCNGNPARAVINGRLIRMGEVVDPGLGITFEGIDNGKRHLVFKDKAGATVSRRF